MEATVQMHDSGDERDDVIPKTINNNYKSLLDSDSEEDPIQEQGSVYKSKAISSTSSDSEENIASESEIAVSTAEPHASRRKNSNPKKKILPVKTQRVR